MKFKMGLSLCHFQLNMVSKKIRVITFSFYLHFTQRQLLANRVVRTKSIYGMDFH